MSEETSNGRGRPPGVKNGEGKSLAPIANWSPKHDMVVNLYVAMYSNQEIADAVELTTARVSQILNDPQAKNLIRESQERLRVRMSEQVEEGLAAICIKAVENIRETIELEGLVHGSDFKKHQDRVSLDLLKGRGFLSKDITQKDVERPPINSMMAERLISALEKSNEAVDLARQEREIVVEEAEVVPSSPEKPEKAGVFTRES